MHTTSGESQVSNRNGIGRFVAGFMANLPHEGLNEVGVTIRNGFLRIGLSRNMVNVSRQVSIVEIGSVIHVESLGQWYAEDMLKEIEGAEQS